MAVNEPSSSSSLPKLQILPQSSLQSHTFVKPTKLINEGSHVSRFLTSKAYTDIGTFLLQLNHALCPRMQHDSRIPRTFPLMRSQPSTAPCIRSLETLLSDMEKLIEQAPPDPGPRRFGNVSFRKWFALVEENLDSFLGAGLLGEVLSLTGRDEVSAKDEVRTYLLGAFGSAQRLDYGTGHELSFLAFLGCLWKLGYFKTDGHQGQSENGDMERQIVLGVIESYLTVIRRLILTYTLEPAGSHGVWGLDDHSFIPYIFGSAQFTRPISSETEAMPLEGSVKGAPNPSDITQTIVVEDQRQTNMYFSAIGFIYDVKKGPFWEHSPILFDISGIRDGWGKINKGMIKMFNAEVLSKFPVVQHFPFGSLFSWDTDPSAAPPSQSVHIANQTAAGASAQAQAASPSQTSTASTVAPWAAATKMPPTSGPGIPYSRVPPGPSSGSLASRQMNRREVGPKTESGSTAAQMTITKAPWA